MIEAEKFFTLLEEGEFSLFREMADQCPRIRILCDKEGDLLLHRAVDVGSLDSCKYLLEKGIPATCPGSSGASPLHYAAARGYLDIMRVLLRAAGPDHSPVNGIGMTPLHVAAGEGRLAIVKLLIARGANCLARNKYDRLPVHYAAGADQLEVVKWLVKRNPELVERPDAFGQRPIHWALQFECGRTAAWLIRCGVNLKCRDIYGRSPLCFTRKQILPPLQRAISGGDVRKVKELPMKPGMLNRRGELGRTALHMAAFARSRDIFRWLRKKGADTEIRDDYGWTPLTLLGYRRLTGSSEANRMTVEEG